MWRKQDRKFSLYFRIMGLVMLIVGIGLIVDGIGNYVDQSPEKHRKCSNVSNTRTSVRSSA